MKLVIAIIQYEDAHNLTDALRKQRFQCTKLASTGGFLSRGNTTIISGVEDDKVDECVNIIKENCKVRKEPFPMVQSSSIGMSMSNPQIVDIQVGGAIVFVVPIDKFERI